MGTENDTAALQKRLDAAELALAIERSPFIRKNVALPEMASAVLAEHFKREGQAFVAKGIHGENLYSATRYGQPSSVDEAVEQLLRNHPHKDFLLAKPQESNPTASAGSGTASAPSGQIGGTMKRSAWDQLRPIERAEHIKVGGKIID